VNRFTRAATALRQCGRTSDGWSALLVERIMSKSNDVSALDNRALADIELEAVSGGTLGLANMLGQVVAQAISQATTELTKESGGPSPSSPSPGWPIGW
jgi:hypothetical protein